MALLIRQGRVFRTWGGMFVSQPFISGQLAAFTKYEKEQVFLKANPPFTIEFRDVDGELITRNPIPLTLNGKPKIDLFGTKKAKTF